MPSSENVTVAVTGGAGLIGSHIVDELIAKGDRVIVIDDFSKGSLDNLENSRSRIEIREGDLEEYSFTEAALADCDVVYHLASRAYGVGYGKGHHLEIMAHNDRISTNIIEALDKHRPKQLLVTSSSCVYDDNGPDTIPELPVFLDDPEQVNKGYGWSKRFLECKASLFAEETGVSVTIVRPFNIYGERYCWAGQYSQAIPMLIKRILDGENPVQVWGSGNQRRSYIHASDCARMMVALVNNKYCNSPVNIGSRETIKIKNLVELICDIASLAPPLEFDLSKPEGRLVKSADTSLFESVVPDFTFDVSLRDGLTRMLDWHARTFQSADKVAAI